ncbi:MAG: hypothetical protein COA96_11155 [SAR86 cluster bacterium]|uniref:Ice-binding protein C-terminal domain-containing protein n=1 Tax=SAR86 cluster bacterium TaxID=2030880 RepID=A0A2A5AWK6_9GAMM|nr:MAG: hypothetical protein COA96_11155 [SAR86 cluster bacterium]
MKISKVFGAAITGLVLVTSSAHAGLIDNGNSTIDTASGLEWLDLTLTTGQSYNNIHTDGFGGYAASGYVSATLDQLCGLWGSLGDDTSGCASTSPTQGIALSTSSAAIFTSLLGVTYTPYTGTFGMYDSGLLSSGFVGLACINGGASSGCISGSPSLPNAIHIPSWIGTSDTHSLVGHWLVRSTSVPEPATLGLLGLSLIGMGYTRRRKTIKSV